MNEIVAVGKSDGIDLETENSSFCINNTMKDLINLGGCDLLSNFTDAFTADCEKNTSCTLFVPSGIDIATILASPECAVAGIDTVYISYTCSTENISSFGYETTKTNFAFVLVGCDIFCMFVLFCLYLYLNSKIKTEEKVYKQNYSLVSDFTFRLSNLKLKGEEIESEVDELVDHVRKVLLNEDNLQDDQHPIFDINYPYLNDERIEMLDRRVDLASERLKQTR